MPRYALVALVLAAGASLAIQPAVNAQLAKHVSSLGAAFISLSGSTLVVGIALVAAGGFGDLRGAADVQPLYLFGGLFGALNVTVALFAVTKLGAGGVAAITLSSQLVTAGVLDALGVLGLSQTGLTPTRLIGFGLLLAGVLLVTLR